MSSNRRQQHQPKILPTALPIYGQRDETSRTQYYKSFHIRWSDEYNWVVYIGDVIAVSTTDLSVQTLHEWEPDHLKKESTHWKIGLIVGMTDVLTMKENTQHCQVMWLHKVLDTKFHKKLRGSYRPYKKSEKTSRLPHLLLRSSDVEEIDPARILPVRITMLNKDEFYDGVLHEEETRFHLHFNCSKHLTSQNELTNEDPDQWKMFNFEVSHLTKKVPKPLELAWQHWSAACQVDGLRALLEKAFFQACQEKHSKKYIASKNEEWQANMAKQDDVGTSNDDANNKRRRQRPEEDTGRSSSKKQKKIMKRTRIIEPHEMADATKKQSISNDFVKPSKQQHRTKSSLSLSITEMARSVGNKATWSKKIKSKLSSKVVPGNDSTTAAPKKRGRRPRKVQKSYKDDDDDDDDDHDDDDYVPVSNISRPRKQKVDDKKGEVTSNNCKPTGKKRGRPPKQKTNPTIEVAAKRGRLPKIDSLEGDFNDDDDDDDNSLHITVKPVSAKLHESRQMNGITTSHYGSVKVSVDFGVFGENKYKHVAGKYFAISIGDVLPVRCEDAMKDDWTPFCVPWSAVQVLDIFHTDESLTSSSQYVHGRGADIDWQLSVRWFYRHTETEPAIQEQLDRLHFSKQYSLLESIDSSSIDIACALPARVILSSDNLYQNGRLDLLTTSVGKDRMPEIRMQCQHLKTKKQQVTAISGWTNYNENISAMPPPLNRGLDLLMKVLKKKYETYLTEWEYSHVTATSGSSGSKTTLKQMLPPPTATSTTRNITNGTAEKNDGVVTVDTEDSNSKTELGVEPLTSTPIYENWGKKFFEAVYVDVEKKTLNASYHPKEQVGDRWLLKVGYVVPIHFEESPPSNNLNHSNGSKVWYPYIAGWSPAQVVSIYQDETSGEWMMEIRWFNRFHELTERQQQGLKPLDGPMAVFETEEYQHVQVSSAFPGRIIVQSSNMDDWTVATSKNSGIPLIPLLCTHICLDDDVDTAADWNKYDLPSNVIPRPLSRGLLLSSSGRERQFCFLTLSRWYKKSILQRSHEPDSEAIRNWLTKSRPVLLNDKSLTTFEPSENVATPAEWICEQDNSKKVDMLNISIPRGLFTTSQDGQPKRDKRHMFTCSAGDMICYYDPAAGPRPDHLVARNPRYPCHPFRVPWSFGQVLKISSDDHGSETPRVVVRRFYRTSQLPKEFQDVLMPGNDEQCEDIFETDDVVDSISANLILDVPNLYLGHHVRAITNTVTSVKRATSLISCRCKHFFRTKFNVIQPIVSSGYTPDDSFSGLCERGVKLLNQTTTAPASTSSSILSCTRNRKELDVHALLGVQAMKKKLDTSKPFFQDGPGMRTYFTKSSVSPNWSELEDTDFFGYDKSKNWTISLGDFVAARSPNNSTSEMQSYPFVSPWLPCQVVAIFADENDAHGGAVQFELVEVETSTQTNGSVPFVRRRSTVRRYAVSSEDLLGPIVLLPYNQQEGMDWDKVSKDLPLLLCKCDQHFDPRVYNLLHFSKVYSDEALQRIKQSLGNADLAHKHDIPAWTSCKPLFDDYSIRRRFFAELTIASQFSAVEGNSSSDDKMPWTIRTGDIVAVHCSGRRRCPLECNWEVAEVVCIWEEFSSADEQRKSQDLYSTSGNETRIVKVEIRWFYEQTHLAGFAPSNTTIPSGEVFETDHVDTIDPIESLLMPAMLLSPDDWPHRQPEMFGGMPVPQFVCSRFWSTTRKSLVPCGDLSSRKGRGRLYSKVLPEVSTTAKSTNQRRSSNDVAKPSPMGQSSLAWKSSVRRIINKFSLKDASKGVYQGDAVLVQREKEYDRLCRFLRTAIMGEAGPGGAKSSMLLAGPPGVGKTACFRSAIATLRNEQREGRIPRFDFVPLNGMEMRHPFESYVKLWEAMTGRNHVGSHERACEKLEAIFTKPQKRNVKNAGKILVVLLDEIDYLITEKQTVLYNFFDWPKRAAELGDGRRLVVVGISNTLNLADQLLPSVQSRLGSEKLIFKAYNLNSTIEILKAKIEESLPVGKIFSDDAILFAAKKTAALSGDIRKAFHLCRSAAELVLRRYETMEMTEGTSGSTTTTSESSAEFPQVKITDVQKASRDSFNMALKTMISFSTSFQALLLVSLAALCRTSGREEGSFDIKDIMRKMEAISGASGDPQYSPPPSFGETLDLLSRLGEFKLVELRTGTSTLCRFRAISSSSGGAWPVVSPIFDEQTLLQGLRSTQHRSLAEKNLPNMY